MALKHGGPANAWHGHFEPKRVPEGVWIRCDGCQATLFRKQVEQNDNVCPECNHHFAVSAVDRIAQLVGRDTFEEWVAILAALDLLIAPEGLATFLALSQRVPTLALYLAPDAVLRMQVAWRRSAVCLRPGLRCDDARSRWVLPETAQLAAAVLARLDPDALHRAQA